MIPGSKKPHRWARPDTLQSSQASSHGKSGAQAVEPAARVQPSAASAAATQRATPLATRTAQISSADFMPGAGSPRNALTRALRNDGELARRLIRAARTPQLDLSAFSAQSIESMSPDAWAALATIAQNRVSEVVMPRGMTALPEGLERFGALRYIVVPYFHGTRIDVPAALAHTRFAGWGSNAQKIVVQRHGAAGAVSKSNLRGNVYFRQAAPRAAETEAQAQARTLSEKFNAQVKFAQPSRMSGDAILCRHLSVAWLREKTAHALVAADSKDAGGSRFDYEKFASHAAIQQHVRPADELAYRHIHSASSECHVVPLDCWSDFLTRQVAGMNIGERRHFLLDSDRHAMAMELRCKADDHGEHQYVIDFYDPNDTTTHLRTTLGRFELERGWLNRGLSAWLGPSTSHYFGGADPYVVVNRVDATTFSVGAATPRQADRAPLLHGDRAPSASMFFALMRGNFDAALHAQLARLPSAHADRLRILAARNSDSVPGLCTAIAMGNVETVRLMLDVIIDRERTLGLEQRDKVSLLGAAARGAEDFLASWSALRVAFHYDNPVIITLLVRTILECDLTHAQKIDLLANRNVDGHFGFRALGASPAGRGAFLDAFKQASEAQFPMLARIELGDLMGAALPLSDDNRDGKGK